MGCETHLDDSYYATEVFTVQFIIKIDVMVVGVFVAIKNDLKSLQDPDINVSVELIWAKLSLKGIAPVYICSFYRPPNSDSEPILQLGKFLMWPA